LAEVGDDERDDPFHFAASLVRRVAEVPHQEIGTHTFSHHCCLEEDHTPDDFHADLQAAVDVTRDKLGHAPASIAFPRNQFDGRHVAACGALGLDAYRGTGTRWAYRPRPAHDESTVRRAVRLADAYLPLTGTDRVPGPDTSCRPVDVAASRYLRPYSVLRRHLEPLRIRRIESGLRQVAAEGGFYHLWWHPHDFGTHLRENLGVMQRILRRFRALRDGFGMESLTMHEAAKRALDVRAAGVAPPHRG
jgi:peptidoglycan/xylan/chitin deacetylase (PgdA/CDA1 family)